MKFKKDILKGKNLLLIFAAFLCLFGLIYGIVNIIVWKIDNEKTTEEISATQETTAVESVSDSDSTEIIEQKTNIPRSNPYWDYIKMNLIDVNFTDLKQKNPDTVGWLQVGGTNINYPFVQTSDNDFYLSHSFDKTENQAGWPFLDYRNNKSDYDKNTIIYGHDLRSGAVFGTLKNILDSTWQSDTNNHIVKISTETENTLWQVFSVYSLPATSDYLRTEFADDNDFLEFAQKLQNRTVFNFDTTLSQNDKILTLSSCYKNSDNRIVLHAKLIKKSSKT